MRYICNKITTYLFQSADFCYVAYNEKKSSPAFGLTDTDAACMNAPGILESSYVGLGFVLSCRRICYNGVSQTKYICITDKTCHCEFINFTCTKHIG